MKQLKTCTGDYTLVDDDIYELICDDHWHYDHGRVFRGVGGHRAESLHSFVLGKPPPGSVIDHKDTNPLNNVRSNLRFATYQQNSFNTSKQSRPTSSKYKGVYRAHTKRKWRAVIQHDGKKIHIGYFHSEIDAAKAYNKKAAELFGEFAYLNKIEGETC